MRLQLYDRGSPQGKKLLNQLDELCQRLQLDCAPEPVTDMSRVYSMGVQGKTILVINSEVVLVDRFPSLKELEDILNDYR